MKPLKYNYSQARIFNRRRHYIENSISPPLEVYQIAKEVDPEFEITLDWAGKLLFGEPGK